MGGIRFPFYFTFTAYVLLLKIYIMETNLEKSYDVTHGCSNWQVIFFFYLCLLTNNPQCVAQTPNRLDTSLDSLSFMRNFCVLVSAC